MFKKSLLLLLSGASLSAAAQQTDVSSSYRSGADRVLGEISQYPVTSGILYNRIFPFSEAGNSSSGGNNPETFVQSLHELELAQTNPELPEMAKDLSRNYRIQSLAGDIHLLTYQTLVDEIDTGRIKDSSIVFSGGLFRFQPSPGKESPFLSTEKTAAVLMAMDPLERGKAYRIHFPTNLPLGKKFRIPESARIRIGEGLWQTLPPGGSISLIFGEDGPQEVKMEISWSGGITRSYHQTLTVQSNASCSHPELFLRPDECPEWKTNPNFAPSLPPTAISASIPFGNITGKGEVWHYLRTGNTSSPGSILLKNPIIVVEGIDFGDTRNGQVIYGKYLSYLSNSSGANSVHLGAQLRNQGHDLIILNFPDGRNPANVNAGTANQGIDGGCDYIERNAMVLVKLIQQVNSQLEPGSKKISIVGSSMGGLIARYALAYMEKNVTTTGSHHCGLFISQDSPQLGANIPIGLQQFIRHLAFLNVSQAKEALEGLNSPAASELLINHVNHLNGSFNHENRSQFIQNLAQNGMPGSLGWPKDPGLRMVALSNGSSAGYRINGSVNPVSPVIGGNEFLVFNFKISIASFSSVIMAVLDGGISSSLNQYAVSNKLEWKCRYAPEQNNNARTFDFSLKTSVLNQVIHNYTEQINWQALDEGISIDASPGGRNNTTGIMADNIRSATINQSPFFISNLVKADRYHCFIPVKSALAFRWNSSGLRNLGENIRERNLVCTGETPFHAYFIASGNDDHIRMTQDAITFLNNQINYVPPSGGISYPAEINGPRAVSSGSQVDFSAVYQGNLQFRTSWSITEMEGISATVIDPFNTTCKVNTSSGVGQENGYFMLRLTTEVKSLNGEWICAGNKTMKVSVRKIQFAGNIQVSCQTNMPKGCYFKLLSATPNYSGLSNGVMDNGYEWQVSRYSNADFGNSCWNGSLTITPSGLGFSGEQKAYINLLHSATGGIGNVFSYYARIRNKMRIPNPDFGAPGEPEFLDLYGPWKLRQLQTQVMTGNCPVCPGAIIVNPEEPVKSEDDEVVVKIPPDIQLPGKLLLSDAGGIKIQEFSVTDDHFIIPLEFLKPGKYRLQLNSGETHAVADFWLKENREEQLVASPSIVLKDFHKEVHFRILDEHYLEEGTGTYQAVLIHEGSGQKQSWNGSLQEFSQASSSLEPGEYRLEIQNGVRSLSCSFEVIPPMENQIFVYPNPASLEIITGITGTEPQENAVIRILNAQGNVVQVTSWNEEQTLVQLKNLDPGLYLLQLINGSNLRNIWFRKD